MHALAHVPTITNSIWKMQYHLAHSELLVHQHIFLMIRSIELLLSRLCCCLSKFMVLCAYRSQQSAVLLLRNAHVFIRPFANLFQLGSCLAGQGISNGLNYLSPHGWPQDPIKTGKREKERWQCCLVVDILYSISHAFLGLLICVMLQQDKPLEYLVRAVLVRD